MNLSFWERVTLWKVFEEVIIYHDYLSVDEMATFMKVWDNIKHTDELEKTGKICKILKKCIHFAREEMELSETEMKNLEDIERKF